jgi:putative endonuclease
MDTRQAVGRWGEATAAEYLQQLGYTIIDRNARTAYGELDLVAVQPSPLGDPCLVFVEVKARRSSTLGPPEISVGVRKQAHLVAAAEAYRTAHPELPAAYRIDVIAIVARPRAAAPEIVHFENALTTG